MLTKLLQKISLTAIFKKPSLKQELIKVVQNCTQTQEVEPLLQKLQEVNDLLVETPKPFHSSVQSDLIALLEKAINTNSHASALIYLTDGGISRMSIWIRTPYDIQIDLSENSSEYVQNQWKEIMKD